MGRTGNPGGAGILRLQLGPGPDGRFLPEPWASVEAANPAVTALAPDTEALLIRAPGPDRDRADCHLVPIDACYELVGRLRRVWKGFDGGQPTGRLGPKSRAAIRDFQASIGLVPDGFASATILARLRGR